MKSLLLSLPFFFASIGVCQEPAPRAVHPDMQDLASHLDSGGVSYMLVSGPYQWEGLKPFIDGMLGLVRGISESDEIDIPPQALDFFDALPHKLGLDEVRATGASTVRRPDGGYLSKNVIQPIPDAEGLIWKLAGNTVNIGDEIRKLPATTAAMMRWSINAPSLYEASKEAASAFPQASEEFQKAEDEILKTGFPFHELLSSLKEGVTLAVSLNPDQQWVIPFPLNMSLPEVGLVAAIEDPSGKLGPYLTTQLKTHSPLPVQDTEIDGTPVASLPLPVPVSTAVALQLASVDGRLLVATNTSLMTELLARREGTQDAPLLAELEGMPDLWASNGWVSDGQLAALLQKGTRTAISLSADGTAETEAIQGMSDLYLHSIYSLPHVALSRTENGMWITLMRHDRPMLTQQSGSTVVAVPMVTGLLAAMALPGFQKARTTARENACVNNLRQLEAAKMQWAIETGATAGDPVTEENAQEYLHALPTCPAGGSYILGPVGEDPVCTTPGHQLPK